ncbi:MAG: AAA family ATPase [Alphaproteobacteria bacterium]|nr:AAA family ATPase [Alphaproteobacteria bacterium]
MSHSPRNTPSIDSRREFLAFVSDDKSIASLRAVATQKGWSDDDIRKGTVRDAAEHLKNARTPYFLLIDIDDNARAMDDLNALADVCEPGVRVIVTSAINEYSFFLTLKEMGIFHYLLKPLDTVALDKALTVTPTQVESPAGGPATNPCKIIAVVGACGGAGVSTIATNLAYLIASKMGQRTIIFDPDPHFGTTALALDMEPSRGLLEAIEKPDRVDSLFMERVMVKYNDKLSMLSAEDDLARNITPHGDTADILFGELRKKHDCIVVDMPRHMNDFTRKVLAGADEVILVSELTVVGLRDAMRLADLIKNKLANPHITVVANRTGIAKKGEMRPKSFEKNLGLPIAYQIPFDAEAYGSANTGRVLAETHKHSQIVAALDAMAHRFFDAKPEESEKPNLAKKLGALMKK